MNSSILGRFLKNNSIFERMNTNLCYKFGKQNFWIFSRGSNQRLNTLLSQHGRLLKRNPAHLIERMNCNKNLVGKN